MYSSKEDEQPANLKLACPLVSQDYSIVTLYSDNFLNHYNVVSMINRQKLHKL